MNGAGGQRVFIVPSRDIVVARLGHRAGASAGMRALDEALGLLMEAIPNHSGSATTLRTASRS